MGFVIIIIEFIVFIPDVVIASQQAYENRSISLTTPHLSISGREQQSNVVKGSIPLLDTT